jgi:hypothetical protein
MSTPHYINETKSDMRGIKPGWYAMDAGGKLSSGPFSSREDCLSRDAHTRKQFEAITAQTKELTEIAQKVTTEIAEPLKAGVTKAFNNRTA